MYPILSTETNTGLLRIDIACPMVVDLRLQIHKRGVLESVKCLQSIHHHLRHC